MVQTGQLCLNGPNSCYCGWWKAEGKKLFGRDGVHAFLYRTHLRFLETALLARLTAYRQEVGRPWMAVSEARRGEGMPYVACGETVQQAATMAPLGWVRRIDGLAVREVIQTGVSGEGGNGHPHRNQAEDPAPGVRTTEAAAYGTGLGLLTYVVSRCL
jgi:hypothetical protein